MMHSDCEYCQKDSLVYNLKHCFDCAVRLVNKSAKDKDRINATLSYIERYQEKQKVKDEAFKRRKKAKKNPPPERAGGLFD